MYRTDFISTEMNNMIPFNIPRKWYGRNIEVISFSLDMPQIPLQENCGEYLWEQMQTVVNIKSVKALATK